MTKLIAVFIFYDKSAGAQSILSFSKEFRHCNTVVFDGSDWIAIEFDRAGFIVRRVKVHDSERFLAKLQLIKEVTAIVSVVIVKRKNVCWMPWWVRSCNQVSRYASGIDIGFTDRKSVV